MPYACERDVYPRPQDFSRRGDFLRPQAPEARAISASGEARRTPDPATRGQRTWGFAPRWYISAPPALLLATFLVCAATVFGCKSAPAPVSTKVLCKQPLVAYPPRPTNPPPPFKVFHQTNNSITLVTDEHANDEQIKAIIWQLRDAAHAHTFSTLHIDQAAIDKRDPIMWFHLYRGSKCASEKYTSGSLPCGGAYHASGDYILGSFANKDHDDGALLKDEDHETHLWNPDAPYESANH